MLGLRVAAGLFGVVGPEPHYRRRRSLEHGLSRPCRPAVARAGSDGARRSAGPCRPARMGAYRSDRTLRLDRGEPGRAISAATRGSFYVPAPGRLAYDFEQIVWVTPRTPADAEKSQPSFVGNRVLVAFFSVGYSAAAQSRNAGDEQSGAKTALPGGPRVGPRLKSHKFLEMSLRAT
jgi:hypothetical protein